MKVSPQIQRLFLLIFTIIVYAINAISISSLSSLYIFFFTLPFYPLIVNLRIYKKFV